MNERFVESPQLGLGRLCSRVLFTMYFTGCAVHGRENIPAEGTYILALNHASMIDPPLVWAFYPDPVYFLTKKELHELPIFGWMCDRVGNIPVDREGKGNLSALRTAKKYLTDYQRNLGIFIEGSRSADGSLGEGEQGTAYLAQSTGRPVVPAFIQGSHDVLPKGRIVPRFSTKLSLHIGAPITIGADEEREKATERLLEAIAILDPTKQKGGAI